MPALPALPRRGAAAALTRAHIVAAPPPPLPAISCVASVACSVSDTVDYYRFEKHILQSREPDIVLKYAPTYILVDFFFTFVSRHMQK